MIVQSRNTDVMPLHSLLILTNVLRCFSLSLVYALTCHLFTAIYKLSAKLDVVHQPTWFVGKVSRNFTPREWNLSSFAHLKRNFFVFSLAIHPDTTDCYISCFAFANLASGTSFNICLAHTVWQNVNKANLIYSFCVLQVYKSFPPKIVFLRSFHEPT